MNRKQLDLADDLAISEAPYDLQGGIMRLGLNLRKKLGFNLSSGKPVLAERLYQQVLDNDQYVSKFKEFGVKLPKTLH